MIVSLILWLIGEIITGIITEMLTGDSKANELTKFQFLTIFKILFKILCDIHYRDSAYRYGKNVSHYWTTLLIARVVFFCVNLGKRKEKMRKERRNDTFR